MPLNQRHITPNLSNLLTFGLELNVDTMCGWISETSSM